MSSKSVFTNLTPLPAGISREVVRQFLTSHTGMIDLNPLVKERYPIDPPDWCPPEERQCMWYSLTDRVTYLPGSTKMASDVAYTAAFFDLPDGLQTHSYAPLGV